MRSLTASTSASRDASTAASLGAPRLAGRMLRLGEGAETRNARLESNLGRLALRVDPPATTAPRTFLVPEAVMHRHAPLALTGRAACVCRVQSMHAGGGLQLRLPDRGVDHREALLC